jgi:hypothetical protein
MVILTKPADKASAANKLAARQAGRLPYPHMGPADARVWRAALDLGLLAFERFEYDVRLGGTRATEVGTEHSHFPMWETLLKKRVDVVGWQGARPTLIEVKPVGSFAALGQCLGYGDLWAKEKGSGVVPSLCCVCAFLDPDLAFTFSRFGVRVVQLPWAVAEPLLAQR